MDEKRSTTVGLVEADELRGPLARAGLSIVTGEDFRAAAAAVREHLETVGEIPVIVSDVGRPGMKPWVIRLAAEHAVVVLHREHGTGFAPERAESVHVPTVLSTVLKAAGIDGDGVDDVAVGPEAQTFHAAQPTPDAPAWPTTDDTPDAGSQRPARTESSPAEAAPPELDPWETDTATAPPVNVAEHGVDDTLVDDPWADEAPGDDWVSPRRRSAVQQPGPTSTTRHAATRSPTPPHHQPTHRRPEAQEPAAAEDLFGGSGIKSGGECVVCWAGRGGAGKSTVAITVAQIAAARGLRVVLFDGNIGQGDLRTYLRLGERAIPTIYDIARHGDLRGGALDPDMMAELRGSRLDKLGFLFVAAPSPGLLADGSVTPDVYLRAVEQARQMADLVVVDTQTIEGLDPFGMVDGFVKPLLGGGAWGLGIGNITAPGINNLYWRLRAFADAGVPRQRMLAMLNMAPHNDPWDEQRTEQLLEQLSTYVGVAPFDDQVRRKSNAGLTSAASSTFTPVVTKILYQVTSDRRFSPPPRTSQSFNRPGWKDAVNRIRRRVK